MLLIGADGQQVGIIPLEQALESARTSGLDLVEVAPDARPIVCRLMDWGREKYEREKKAKAARKREHTISLKEVKFRPNIDEHDFETKTRRVRQFLEKGHHAKVSVMFRMRELRRPENGFLVLRRVAESVADIGKIEEPPSRSSTRVASMILAPQKSAKQVS